MATEKREGITSSLPNPDSNIQLGEGAVSSKELLGGDVSTVFVYRPDLTGFEHALAAVQEDQELMCGYALKVAKTSQVEQADADGKFVEVFVTFSPKDTSPQNDVGKAEG